MSGGNESREREGSVGNESRELLSSTVLSVPARDPVSSPSASSPSVDRSVEGSAALSVPASARLEAAAPSGTSGAFVPAPAAPPRQPSPQHGRCANANASAPPPPSSPRAPPPSPPPPPDLPPPASPTTPWAPGLLSALLRVPRRRGAPVAVLVVVRVLASVLVLGVGEEVGEGSGGACAVVGDAGGRVEPIVASCSAWGTLGWKAEGGAMTCATSSHAVEGLLV